MCQSTSFVELTFKGSWEAFNTFCNKPWKQSVLLQNVHLRGIYYLYFEGKAITTAI